MELEVNPIVLATDEEEVEGMPELSGFPHLGKET